MGGGALHRLSLRSRLTLIAAVSVALGSLLVGVIAYYGVRAQLRDRVDDSLRQRGQVVSELRPMLPGDEVARNDVLWARVLAAPSLGAAGGYAQFVLADGRVVGAPDLPTPLPADQRDVMVAAGVEPMFIEDRMVDGANLRVLTTSVRPGVAVQFVRPLDEVSATLHNLVLLLISVGVAATVLAAIVSRFAARAVLAPVADLTEAAEHVSATHDLSRRIETSGRNELGRLADRFNAMLAAVEQARASQRRLVADASHELRTPLTSARTNLEVLQRAGAAMPPAEQRELVDDVTEQLQELSELVNDLVSAAHGSEPDEPVVAVDLAALAGRGLARARRHARGLVFTLDAPPSTVDGQPARLDRALANLLDNAAAWSPPGGLIAVTVRGGRIEVRDQGPGFAADELPLVFDRFFRSASARGRPGSGLGLAIVREIAEAHGGEAGAANAPDGGAVVWIEVPAETRTGSSQVLNGNADGT